MRLAQVGQARQSLLAVTEDLIASAEPSPDGWKSSFDSFISQEPNSSSSVPPHLTALHLCFLGCVPHLGEPTLQTITAPEGIVFAGWNLYNHHGVSASLVVRSFEDVTAPLPHCKVQSRQSSKHRHQEIQAPPDSQSAITLCI